MNKSHALKNITEISRILDKHKCKHWIQNGTLLGFFRSGDFISHDLDTDMCVMFNTFSPSCLKDLISSGFRIDHIFGYVEDSLEIALRSSSVHGDIKTDLFFHYTDNDIQYHCVFAEDEKGQYTRRVDYRYKPFGVKRKEYMGHNFNVPDDELLYIETTYGNKWRETIKEWSYSESPNNVVNTGIVIDEGRSKKKFDKWMYSTT